ncbi:MAG: Zn-dependent hydrolase [Azospirillaceae bacterium]
MTAIDPAPGAALARRLFADLAERTADPPGVTRKAYGEGERIAFDLAAEAAAGQGAERRFDAAGNQYLTIPGVDRERALVIGSHLDSVPHGGNYDGAAGVIAGLALQACLAQAGRTPPVDVTVACLRAEESCWFPHSYIGSKTALGVLDPAVLDDARRSDTGRSLAWHMAEAGFDPDAVRTGTPGLEADRVVAYLEPHIEQAPALVSAGTPIGLVTGIRGSFRYREMVCHGEYAHSGAMPRNLRHDAAVASAELIVALDDLWARLDKEGRDLSITFGQVGTDPAVHSFSKVAGEVRLCLDVRSIEPETLDHVETELARMVAEIEQARGVRFTLGPRSGSTPAPMAEPLRALLGEAATRQGIETLAMPSGAGHDAATFALAGIPAGMLFIRNTHGSHNPDEAMDMADFDRAVAILAAVMDAPGEAWAGLRG